MAKQLVFDEIARKKALKGVQILTQAVQVTLGPKGRNVLIDKKFGSPTVTKDGVTVAKEIEVQDPFENMGAQMVREVASKTSDSAGDGTTTATVLGQALRGMPEEAYDSVEDARQGPAEPLREVRRLRGEGSLAPDGRP